MCVKKSIKSLKVIFNKQVAESSWLLTLEKSDSFANAKPGQFITLSPAHNNTSSNLLKRPFCIYNIVNKSVQVLYKVKGTVTSKMQELLPGDEVEIVGPLGVPFELPKGKNVLLVGGGIGIAPLKFTYQEVVKENTALVLYGARNEQQIVDLGIENVVIHNEQKDGGLVCDKVEELVKKYSITHIMSCGPTLMLQKVAEVSSKLKVDCQVSLEAYMACGFGVCIGCVVETKVGFKKVCSDGPVFKGTDIW